MVTQRGATRGERAQRVHGGGPKATHSVLVPQCCEPGVVRLLEVQTWLAESVKLNDSERLDPAKLATYRSQRRRHQQWEDADDAEI